MASPQKEKGHTETSNELLEALCLFDFNGSDYKILLFTIRKTYGYHKKTDPISIGQYQKGTGLARRTVIDTLNRLVSYNALVKERNSYVSRYGIQKDYDKWLVSKTALVRIDAKTSAKPTSKLVIYTAPTKETKEKQKKVKDYKSLIQKGMDKFRKDYGRY